MAAACAREKDQFWPMHDSLFENQQALEPAKLVGYAQSLGLDGESFEECLSSDRYAKQINADLADANVAGVSATPTFLLGWIGADGSTVQVAAQIRGAQPMAQFAATIDSLLASPPQAEGE